MQSLRTASDKVVDRDWQQKVMFVAEDCACAFVVNAV